MPLHNSATRVCVVLRSSPSAQGLRIPGPHHRRPECRPSPPERRSPWLTSTRADLGSQGRNLKKKKKKVWVCVKMSKPKSQNPNQTKRKNLRWVQFPTISNVLQLYAARSQPFPEPQLYKTSLTSTMFYPCTWRTKFYDTDNDTRVYNSKFMWNEMRRRTVPTGSPRIWASDGRPNRNLFVSWLISCTVTDTAVKKIYH